MIESVFVRIVYRSNIDNDVAGVEDIGVSTAFQIGISISACLAQEENGKCFVAMESAVVRSNAGVFRGSGVLHFLFFCRRFRHECLTRHCETRDTTAGRVDNPSTEGNHRLCKRILHESSYTTMYESIGPLKKSSSVSTSASK